MSFNTNLRFKSNLKSETKSNASETQFGMHYRAQLCKDKTD